MDTAIQIFTACIVIIIAILMIALLLRKTPSEDSRLEEILRNEFRLSREEANRTAAELRKEVSESQNISSNTLVNSIGELGKAQKNQLEAVTNNINELSKSNENRLEKMRNTIDTQLANLQEGNERKLDQMRGVIDDKLQSTLEKRLSESFSIVREQLEAVQRGLGEMRSLANNVGDLSRVLTNVKARGMWGEVQLGAILEQILTPNQYATNVKTKEGSKERVEFAIRLPGPEGQRDSCVWLPIDAKFPQEDYIRLVEASKNSDVKAVNDAVVALLKSIHASAKEINSKYLNPPVTTDFAIMFLPTEGLYAEVLRKPGLLEEIQQKHRVVITGPTTLSAVLNSLQMGFRTLAIEKRSSEVWQVLAAVKTEFEKFGDVLKKLKNQLQAASNTIENTQTRTRVMERKLKDVEKLPEEKTSAVLELAEIEDEFDAFETGQETID